MLVGYMRVSSESDRQITDLQRDALLAAGVDGRHLFEDHASGAKDDRPGLTQALSFVRPGDVLIVGPKLFIEPGTKAFFRLSSVSGPGL
jgi:DNA invertase Pin-like site-specific DNA recombinase